MKALPELLVMLKHHEGVRTKPYRDVVGLWTVGVGHLMYPEQARLPMIDKETGKNPRMEVQLRPEDARVFTMDEVDAILAKDLANFERGVLRLCPVGLTQPRFDGLLSFSFNCGLGGLQRSTIRSAHNRGDFEAAANEFLKYTKAGGKEFPGLVKRRRDERARYLA